MPHRKVKPTSGKDSHFHVSGYHRQPGYNCCLLYTSSIMNYPDIYKEVYVEVAQWIYSRSAQLVAASLTGLIMLLKSYNKNIRKICLVAEGSLFWSKNRKDKNYNMIVMEKLRELFSLFGLEDVEVDIKSMNNANLIGTGIAALS